MIPLSFGPMRRATEPAGEGITAAPLSELMQRCFLNSPTVHAALTSYKQGAINYAQALETAVIALVDQNAEWAERCTKLLQELPLPIRYALSQSQADPTGTPQTTGEQR